MALGSDFLLYLPLSRFITVATMTTQSSLKLFPIPSWQKPFFDKNDCLLVENSVKNEDALAQTS